MLTLTNFSHPSLHIFPKSPPRPNFSQQQQILLPPFPVPATFPVVFPSITAFFHHFPQFSQIFLLAISFLPNFLLTNPHGCDCARLFLEAIPLFFCYPFLTSPYGQRSVRHITLLQGFLGTFLPHQLFLQGFSKAFLLFFRYPFLIFPYRQRNLCLLRLLQRPSETFFSLPMISPRIFRDLSPLLSLSFSLLNNSLSFWTKESLPSETPPGIPWHIPPFFFVILYPFSL